MGNHFEEHLQALREARRKAADKVRAMLAELEAAERDFATATQQIDAFVTQSGAAKAAAGPTSNEGSNDDRQP